MSKSHDAEDSVDDSLHAQIDRLCDEYEAAWRAGQQPRIEDWLPRLPESARGGLVQELVRVDVELRWSRGEAPTAEEYLGRFPAYKQPVEAAFVWAMAKQAAESHSLAVDQAYCGRRVLHIRCPHCRYPIELVDDAPLAELTCPSCHGKFTLATGETLDGAGVPAAGVRRPKTLGHFELLEELGTGGFGTVWKARDTKLDRIAAVKIPRKGNLSPDEVEKFLREARAAAQLQHPNIVSVHEVGLAGDVIYIVSDFIEGRTLDRWLAEQKPAIREAAELCRKLAETLHYAHEHGVIHRDLKPANVTMDAQGEPHVMDFGLAKREAGEITMTMEGQILGTPAYMSPEQARGEGHAADRRSDVYSLGVILFELLTGERPFRGNVRMLLKQVIEDEPPSPRRLDSRIPRDLETVCLKCLENSPRRRYESAAALADELLRFSNGEPVLARPVGSAVRLWRWCRRKPALAAVGVLALASTIAAIVILSVSVVLVSKEKQWAEKQLSRAEVLLYANQIAFALREWETNDLSSAWQYLDACRSDLRGWEYDYLCSLFDKDQQTLKGHTDSVACVAFSPDGKRIASGGGENTVKVWDASSGLETLTLKGHRLGVESVAFSPDGKRIASGSLDETVKVWDASKGPRRVHVERTDGQ